MGSLARDGSGEGAQWHCFSALPGAPCSKKDEAVVGDGGDYYVKRFGFMFGGGRSGMYGLKALQADGLVQQRQEVKPAMVQMRNSVDTYYRNVLPKTSSSSPSYSFNRFRSQPLLRAKPMVELAPKRMGSTYFNTFMAVP